MKSIRASFRRGLVAILLLLAWPAAAADGIAVLSAVLQMNGKEVTFVVNVLNQRDMDVEIVTVEIEARKGVLELRNRLTWTRVPSLRLPRHAELKMDSVHGPRVLFPSGGGFPSSGNALIVLNTGERITTPYVTLPEARSHGS
jgi:hypothetical protein